MKFDSIQRKDNTIALIGNASHGTSYCGITFGDSRSHFKEIYLHFSALAWFTAKFNDVSTVETDSSFICTFQGKDVEEHLVSFIHADYLRNPGGNSNYMYNKWHGAWTDSTILTLEFSKQQVLSINKQPSRTASLRVYPNPAVRSLTVEYPSEIHTLSVYDLLGVRQALEIQSKTSTSVTFDVSRLSEGLYYIHSGTETQKFYVYK